MKYPRTIAVMTVVAALASCATVPVSQREGRVEALVEELNTADIERLAELSARPFLFDGEIVILESDLNTMWTNLRAAGFAFDAATLDELGPVDEDTYRAFGDSMDVRAWFDRYAAEDAGLATVRTTHGTFLILTGDRDGRTPRIFGFTGPTEG
ncbi:MAG: hypothetical protein MI724_02645 [Spirochaetales bacterium]|nr:hypothetical protein [Spirochaetales bacterium]